MLRILRLMIIPSTFLNIVLAHSFDKNISDCYLEHKGSHKVRECGDLVNDPKFLDQWHIIPMPRSEFNDENFLDLGILDVWIKYGFFGQNVVAVINDDGIETTHPDLSSNYNSDLGVDLCDGQSTPNPNPEGINLTRSNTHGTKVAGVLAMAIDNNECGVGVAPAITFGAIRMVCKTIGLSDDYNLDVLITSLNMNVRSIDITINSYHLFVLADMQDAILSALERSATWGRGGQGVVHIYAAQSNKRFGGSCSFNHFLQSIHTIGIASMSPWGTVTNSSCRCAAIMAAVPTHSNEKDFMYTTTIKHGCDSEFGHTSSATPLAAGMIALSMNANPRLTARDFQHLIARASIYENISPSEFITNGAGYRVSLDFGFGLMNALQMVEKALSFRTLPQLNTCVIPIPLTPTDFTPGEIFEISVETNACQGIPTQEVNYVENVQLEVQLTYREWSHLQIDLISPRGTKARLLERGRTQHQSWTVNWIFRSIITWGESPKGKWRVQFHDMRGKKAKKGRTHSFQLKLFGTKEKPKY